MQTPDQLADTAAFMFGVDKRAIFGESRVSRVVEARQALAWALRQRDWSLESIGAFLRRDHTTIIYALRRVDQRRTRSVHYAERLSVLADPIAPPPINWKQRVELLEQRVAQLEKLLTERN